jgi:cob(I)alamin adenosyltransferase
MASRIYTKTGDKGITTLLGGTRVPKNHIRIEAYGTVDELNSYIGLLNDMVQDALSNIMLKEIQDRLFTIGSTLAIDHDKHVKMPLPDLHEEDVHLLEKEIDRMNALLPEMRSFILPGGHITVSTAHIARSVCRRAERNAVNMMENGIQIEPLVIVYLNRLSDHLFVLARFIAHLYGVNEIEWKPRINTHPH